MRSALADVERLGRHGDVALWNLVDDARPMQPESAADVLLLAGLDEIRTRRATSEK